MKRLMSEYFPGEMKMGKREQKQKLNSNKGAILRTGTIRCKILVTNLVPY